MARAAALVFAVFVLIGGEAQATTFRVVVVPEYELGGIVGAVGLLVPGAGPETSEAMARAALIRGEVRNSLRGGLPDGPPLIGVATRSARVPTIFVALPQGGPQPNDRRYPITVAGGGFRGILTSESTRIPGLVSIADIAPTVLGREGSLGWQSSDDPVAELEALDRRIDEHNDVRVPATLLVVALVVALAFLFPRAALTGLLAALAANVALGLAGATDAWAVLLVFAAATCLGGPLLARLVRSHEALALLCAGVIAAYLLVLAFDGPAVALSPFGPTQNARFYGLSNLLETMLLVPALAGAAAAGFRFGSLGFAAVALLSLVTVAGNRFGADGGGAVVLLVGFVVLAVLLSRRALWPVLLGGLAAVGLLLGFDLATGGESHVTRAVEGGPWDFAGDLADRVVLSFERATDRWYLGLLIALGILILAALSARTLRAGRGPVPLAFAAAIATSLVVNDSPNDVVSLGITGFLAVERGMLPARCAGRFSSPLRLPWSWPGAAARRPSSPSPRK
jgi:hypothetical protein